MSDATKHLIEQAADIERMLSTWPEHLRDGNYQAHADDAAALRAVCAEVEHLRVALTNISDIALTALNGLASAPK